MQITSAVPVARMIGANRLVLGNGIVHVVGDASLSAAEERKMRRQLIDKALDALRDAESVS